MEGSDVNWADGAAEAAAGLSEEQRKDFIRLARELQANQGRWGFFVLEYGHVLDRERIAEAIQKLVPGAVQITASNNTHTDWPALEAELINSTALGAPLVQLIGLEHWLDPLESESQTKSRLRAWNIRRESFAHGVPVPVLCWMRAPQVELLATEAPDLWSWRTAVHWFELDAPEKSTLAIPEVLPLEPFTKGIDNRSIRQRLSRINELIYYLQNTSKETLLRAELLDELANLHASVGNFDETLRIRLDLAPLLHRMGELGSWAALMAKISDVLVVKGNFTEALKILYEHVLPTFESLRDTRSLLVTLDRIADILQIQGKLEEALQFRREFQLPFDKAQGDMHAYAVTLSKIADIYHAKKEIDEAMRIRQEEVLPIFEKLGDLQSQGAVWRRIAENLAEKGEISKALSTLRGKALPVFKELGAIQYQATTMSGIADLLQAQGEMNEALEIRRKEVLPIHERTGNARELLVARTKLALNLLERGHETDHPEIKQLFTQAFSSAIQMELPEAKEISKLHQRIFGNPLLPADAQAPAGKSE